MITLLHHCLILGVGIIFGMVFGAYLALYFRNREEMDQEARDAE